MYFKPFYALGFLSLFALTGCGGDDSSSGSSSENNTGSSAVLTQTYQLESDFSVCENGGVSIDLGIDTNSNGLLDDDEVTETKVVCHGVDGDDGTDGEAADQLLSINDVTANEGDGSLTFTVILNQVSDQALSFNYGTVDVTTDAAEDYTAAAGSIVFEAGETEQNVEIALINDSDYECNEYFLLQLSGGYSAFGVIEADNDPNTVNFAQSAIEVLENADTATLTLTLDNPHCEDVTLPVSYQSDDATQGSDYVQADAVIYAGDSIATLDIDIIDDDEAEERETLTLTIADHGVLTAGDSDTATLAILPVVGSVNGNYYATCAMSVDGLAKCWGYGDNNTFFHTGADEYGEFDWQMGENLPAAQVGNNTILDLYAAEYLGCALFEGGVVKCVGDSDYIGADASLYGTVVGNTEDELGDNLFTLDLGSGFVVEQLELGAEHGCAVSNAGELKCWGDNTYGLLGYDSTDDIGDADGANMGDALAVVDLGTDETVEQVSTGYRHTCALLQGGNVKCWGRNHRGQLGYGDSVNRGNGLDENSNPLADNETEMGDELAYVNLGAGRTAKAIFTGYRNSCAILDNNDLKCWGDNHYGQLGQGSTTHIGDDDNEMGDYLPAIELGTNLYAVDVAISYYHICAILNDATVKCWGEGEYIPDGKGSEYTIGDGKDENDVDLAVPLSEMGDNLARIDLGDISTASDITGMGYQTCAVLTNGTLKCWGYSEYGILGIPEYYDDTLGDDTDETGVNLPTVALF